MTKEINILAGGPSSLVPDITQATNNDAIWVGVDRGVYHLISKGITPDVAFGDFDSVTEEELQKIKAAVEQLNIYAPEKDETDMELALNWAINQNPAKIRIYGATGGRLDHLFANVQLLLKPLSLQKNIHIEIIDQKNHVFVKAPGTYKIKKNPGRKYVSFVPISLEIKGLTLVGFKYPLKDCHIQIGSTLCISNELIDNCGTFSFDEGILMVVRSQD